RRAIGHGQIRLRRLGRECSEARRSRSARRGPRRRARRAYAGPARMIRALIILAVLFALGIGFVWIAERPGELVLTWQGYEIRTSVMAAVLGLVVFVGLLVFVWRLVILVIRSPHLLGRYMEGRRRE